MAARRTLRRTAALTTLWRAVRGARRPGGPGLAARLRALPRMAAGSLTGRYPDLPAGRLALMVVAALYVVSPVDVLPEVLLPVLGLGDDAVVLAWLAGAVLAETDRFLDWEGGRTDRSAPETGDPATRGRTVTGHVVA